MLSVNKYGKVIDSLGRIIITSTSKLLYTVSAHFIHLASNLYISGFVSLRFDIDRFERNFYKHHNND